jgi:hypothetical protein
VRSTLRRRTRRSSSAPDSGAGRAPRAIAGLPDLARSTGVVRDHVTLSDLVVLLRSVPGQEVAAERRARYLDIVLAGLRVSPFPGPLLSRSRPARGLGR